MTKLAWILNEANFNFKCTWALIILCFFSSFKIIRRYRFALKNLVNSISLVRTLSIYFILLNITFLNILFFFQVFFLHLNFCIFLFLSRFFIRLECLIFFKIYQWLFIESFCISTTLFFLIFIFIYKVLLNT